MLTNLINHRMQSILISAKPLVAFRSASDMAIANRMKELNDTKQFKKVLQLFDEYKKNNPEIPSNKIITQALKACAKIGDLRQGSTIHRLMSSQTKNDPYILVSLIHLYMQCGDVQQAESLFERSSNKSLQSYGAMMKGYIKHNQAQKAIDLFHKIKNPDDVIILLLFNACAQLGTNEALNVVKKVASEIPKSFHTNPYLSTSLADALMKCGDVAYAQSLFDASSNKSLESYGAMMKGYTQHNQAQKAIDLFKEIKNPDEVIILLLFNACAQLGTNEALNVVKKVASEIPKAFHTNPYVSTSLADALMKCGDIAYAQSLFDASSNKSLQLYGAMMKGYVKNNQAQKAIDLFKEIKNPHEVIILLLFNACAQLGTNEALNVVKKVASEIPKSFHTNPRLSTSLADALMKCGDVAYAQSLFDASSKKSLESYGAMMKGYVKNNQAQKAIDLFKEMKNPDEVIILLLFNACAQLGTNEALNVVKKVASEIPKSFHTNPRLSTSLADALMKCGDVAYAQSLFDASSNKSLQLYGAMMKGYTQHNQAQKAIDLFKEIKNPDEVIILLLFNGCAQLGTNEALNVVKKVASEIPKSFHTNPRLSTSLVDALMKCGDVTYAQSLFDASSNKSLQLYGAMMKGYVKNNQAQKAIDLFEEINNPDEVIILLLFNACAQLANTEALNLAKQVSAIIPKSFYSNPLLSSSLLDAFIKCGDSSFAETLFLQIPRSVETYRSLMTAFNNENNPRKTLELFHQMKKIDAIQPNVVIYLCVIKALAQIGDDPLCELTLQDMPHSMLIDDKIPGALIDMFGKTANIDRAKELFQKKTQPSSHEYTAMINSYGLNGMGNEAVELFQRMPVESVNEVSHVCVLNACSHSGLVDQARSIFENISIKTDFIYTTMIDCLSRAAMFEEAQKLIDRYELDHSPTLSMYMALLSGARNEKNTRLSQQIFSRMKQLFPQSTKSLTSASVLLANVYGSSGELDKASDIRIALNKSGAKKVVGVTRRVFKGKVFEFRAHDQSHPLTPEIYMESAKISKELLEHGHKYDPSWITRPLDPVETIESVLCGHSERLAIAFSFVVEPNASRIQLTKNLRVCGDCHRATKLIAAIRQCDIIVRDANRIHHFHKNGRCSCNDYF